VINGTTVAQVTEATVTYYHELVRHDLLSAESRPPESHLDVGARSNFVSRDGLMKSQPTFALDEACETMWETTGCVPVRIEGEESAHLVTSTCRD
jgi:hypothetical protein